MKTALVVMVALFATAATETSSEREIPIKADDGSTFGVLWTSATEGTLVLTQDGAEAMVIGKCSDDEVVRVPSPSGAITARVDVRNCGATVDFATRVAISAKDERVTLATFAGRPRVDLQWRTDDTLEVRHSMVEAGDVFRLDAAGLGVSVDYVATPGKVGVTDRETIDFANVNYGATGLAAGMPRELLLRLAGWSQEAAGLHRKEWSHWFAASPYGDDPAGHAKIEDGFRVFEQYEAGK